MSALLEIKELTLEQGSNYRLRDINLSISSGEKIALLGKSGAGKSTLIEIANGSLKPSSGNVKWKGIEINKLPRKQRTRIGTIWQDLRLIEELSVGQNINSGALGRKNLFWAIRNLLGIIELKTCYSCLEATNLSPQIVDIPVKKLSGGQRQRVAIARLIRQQPEIILADEPLSDLDPKRANFILNILLNKANIDFIQIPQTCMVSLHKPELIHNFTRVIGIKNGEIIVDIKSTEIQNKMLDCIYQ